MTQQISRFIQAIDPVKEKIKKKMQDQIRKQCNKFEPDNPYFKYFLSKSFINTCSQVDRFKNGQWTTDGPLGLLFYN